MNDKFYFLENELKTVTKKAMIYARKTHDEIFNENQNINAVIAYLNYANSLISSANAIYKSNYEILEHSDIDDFLAQFDIFVLEVLSNISENHSHQWSDIEFTNLEKSYKQCVLFK